MSRWILAATVSVALVGCQENGISSRNASPTVTITSHLEGDQVVESIPFIARATAGDPDGRPEDLLAQWFAGGELVCANANCDEEGLTECEITMWQDTNPPRIQVEVRDGRNAAASYAVDLEVVAVSESGEAPTAEIIEPSNGGVSGLGEPITFQGKVADLQDDPTLLSLSWTSDKDGEFNTNGASSGGDALFISADLSPGPHVITLTVTDTDDNYSTDIITHTINGKPSAPVVSITPDPAPSSQDLLANIDVESVDPEGDPITYRYLWIKDGIPTGNTSALIVSSETSRAENWTVRVTPNDGLLDGDLGEASVIIENAPPVVNSAVLSPDPAFTDDVLTAAITTSDADNDPVNVTYEWTVDGLPAGGNSNTLNGITDFDKGQLVQVTVTPNDGSLDGSPVGSNILTIQNAPPTAPVVSIAPTAPVEQADDLLCSIDTFSTDPDGDLISYSFAWEVDGIAYPDVGHVGPFTTNFPFDSASLADTWDGEEWACLVTATDDDLADSVPGTDLVTIGQYTFLPDYNGLFDIVPTANYTCAFGAVNMNISSFTFVDVGGVLSVSGAPTTMTQNPGPVDENFNASGTLFGTCNETYVISGSFANNDEFAGLFEAQFNGPLCFNCVDQSWNITGTRR